LQHGSAEITARGHGHELQSARPLIKLQSGVRVDFCQRRAYQRRENLGVPPSLYIQVRNAGYPAGERILALGGQGITWMGQPSRQKSPYFLCVQNFAEAPQFAR